MFLDRRGARHYFGGWAGLDFVRLSFCGAVKRAASSIMSGRAADLFVDLGDGTVAAAVSKQCRDCGETKAIGVFYEGGHTRASRCIPCYERYWQTWNDKRAHWPLADVVAQKVVQANKRSRYRKSTGPPLAVASAVALWKACSGRCAHCATELTFAWSPRAVNPNHAVLDRIRTGANESYAGNVQWMCHSCNTEKGAWDLLAQKDAEIARLRAEVAALLQAAH